MSSEAFLWAKFCVLRLHYGALKDIDLNGK